MLENYEKSVYAGLLGKVIGVYLGRPFEGWSKEKIEEKWGNIEGYVHEDVGHPLVVTDDDISGTIAFARVLSDSGLYAETPDDFYGKTWLNYLIEDKTVLWWGGMGVSTEHTAWLRLKDGVSSPESGSIELNGKTVSDQIGGQIFIEAFGLVAPNNPDLAVKLAEKAARVSHDGEGVYGALVVAALVSMAFAEKDMDVLLDRAVEYVPKDSSIAKIHKDVRAWCKTDGDWRITYEKIKEQYGYEKFGGGCHMIPNHAIMVMAWCYAPDNFYESQKIINTAGWDTDCNAANVGSVMGVKLGLEAINKDYEFQKPFADRIMVPTADGTNSFTDVLNAAFVIADMGKEIMNEVDDSALPTHHFSLPGALHGYMLEEETENAELTNAEYSDGQRGLCIEVKSNLKESVLISSPLITRSFGLTGTYGAVGTSPLVSGKVVAADICADIDFNNDTEVSIMIRTYDPETTKPTRVIKGDAVLLKAGDEKKIELKIPDLQGWPVYDVGFEIKSSSGQGKIFIKSVDFKGQPNIQFDSNLCREKDFNSCAGWISTMDRLRPSKNWEEGAEDCLGFIKNKDQGFLVTGDRSWSSYQFETRISSKVKPNNLGIVCYYQGLERYITFVYRNNRFELIEHYYKDRLLGVVDRTWEAQKEITISISCQNGKVDVLMDDELVISSDDITLDCGGAGFINEHGFANVRNVSLKSF